MYEIELNATQNEMANTMINDIEEEELNKTKNNKNNKKKEYYYTSFLFDKNPNALVDQFDNSFITKQKLNETVEEIYRNNNKFNHVNPIRLRKTIFGNNKKTEMKRHTKEEAVKELITNLKTQYIIFKVKTFVRNYQIATDDSINKNNYKIALIFRNISLYIYGLIMLFEKPWFCHDSTTIPLPKSFKFVENCDNISFSKIPFIYSGVLRVIEIFFTITITLTQLIKYNIEFGLRNTNTGANKSYNIIQFILYISLFLCFADSIYSLFSNKFPIINFLCRPFIFIYMIRRLRNNWKRILKVLWKTKKVYLVLVINMISFSVIGYSLFKKKGGFFDSFGETVLQLYILLSTCNFPDIMLEAMETSKFAIFYFVLCLCINYFILLSYLNNLYTTKYYNVNKRDCFYIIRDVIDNKYNQHIFTTKKFERFILKQKYLYHLNNDEYDNFLVLFNIYNRNSDLYQRLVLSEQLTPEVEMINNTKYGSFILESMLVEIIINILYLLCTMSITPFFTSSIDSLFNNLFFFIFHLISSCVILYEPILLIKNLGVKRIFKKHLSRTLFHIFNVVVIISLLFVYFLDGNDEGKKQIYDKFLRILKIFISFRTIRISVFLDKFRIIQNIYIIINISKEMLSRNLLTLYSFILIFSTFSILLTGGNIEKSENDPFKNYDIPKNYAHINFNDFPSSYISCFCLLMINNLNILVKSLTIKSEHKLFYEFYFANFYVFSTLILINIIQTLILEMYLVSDNSLSDKKEDKEKKENNLQGNFSKVDELIDDNDTETENENESKEIKIN